jgi:formate--tetrahydrofolate ligase
MGMSHSDFVVTEAGFGSDLGAEKFFDIKCTSAGLSPKVVVLVATVRALKYHGGADLKNLAHPNPNAVAKGLENLEKHLENMSHFNVPAVVAINQFTSDTDEEIQQIQRRTAAIGIDAIVADVWSRGGGGAEDLAHAVVQQSQSTNAGRAFTPLYQWSWPVKQKIETICRQIYGAADVDYAPRANQDLKKIARLKLDGLPVCMAKTQKSLSDNPMLFGRPKNFTVSVREIEIAAGAGFLIPITGDIMRMPGLPREPAAEKIDIDENGQITGLF